MIFEIIFHGSHPTTCGRGEKTEKGNIFKEEKETNEFS